MKGPVVTGFASLSSGELGIPRIVGHERGIGSANERIRDSFHLDSKITLRYG